MEFIFQIAGKDPDPHLGIVEGYIQEGINQVSLIELILVSSISFSESDCAAYIGKNVTIGFGDLIDGSLLWSRFDGIIYEIHVLDALGVEAGASKYQMIIRPRFWDMNFTVRAQSFQDKSRIEVVEEIFKFSALTLDTDYKKFYFKEDVYLKQSQILQNSISDLVFVQNLLSEAGINYFLCADKDGKTREFIKLVDLNFFFVLAFKKVIPYNPAAGLMGGYNISSLETHYRASTAAAIAAANLGDGSVKVYSKREDVDKGYAGAYMSYGCEGQEEKVANQNALTRMQHFKSNQVIYEGRSNHFIIRPGEKIKQGDKNGNLEREILITSVFHHFWQTNPSALTADSIPEYSNLFSGMKKEAEYRPDQTSGKTIVELKRMFTQKHSMPGVDEGDGGTVSRTDLEDVEKYLLKKQIQELTKELAVAKDLSGLMIGEVIEDAKVTDGKELVCKVKNEKFPDGLTVKVALGWLTKQGWLYLLPRIGVQVYFQFINGEGGQNEAVMVGYRPTATYPVPDPKKTTDSTQLGAGDAPKLGEPADKVVGSSKFAPVNKYRNALMGENGVAEVAVVDGGEDSVYISADNRICLISKKSISISTGSLCESAGSMSQQFGSMSRGVKNDEKISVSGNQEVSVGANHSLKVTGTSTENVTGKIDISSADAISAFGKGGVTLKDDAGSKLVIAKDTVTIAEPGDNSVIIVPGGVLVKAGGATMHAVKDSEVYLVIGDSQLDLTTGQAVLFSGASEITLTKGGDLTVKGTNVTVKGDNVTVDGKNVTITGSAISAVNGGMVKLNC